MGTSDVRAVLLDIEGTTSSLAFVKDQLFPFARRRIADFVRDHAAELRDIIDDIRRIEGDPRLEGAQISAVLLRWMDEDRKITPLKTLQGIIWKEGFDSGELRSHIYDDALQALRRWHGQGLRLYIYSSGSVAAQKLLFAHTERGDLTPLLSGYFDTTTGPKLEAASYRAISAAVALPAAQILFLSDHAGEIEAASAAGLKAVLVNRESAPAADTVASFDAIDLGLAPHPQRPATPAGYTPLRPESVPAYLARQEAIAARLGGAPAQWRTREVGDGNLNLVFVVKGPEGSVVVKQALPYVRLVGESWPLPLSRAHFEALALAEQARWAPQYVPALYHSDPIMALTVMEFLGAHVVLRKGLIGGIRYAQVGRHLGEFLARTLYFTSDLHLGAAMKKQRLAGYLGNTATCRISEDLIFDEPYFAAPLNRHTRPQLDAAVAALRRDAPLKLAAQEMKWRFLNCPEALIHGDLHTGSVMVSALDTRVIDPEFAFFGPMGFDVGAILGNLLMAYLSQPGHEKQPGERVPYGTYLLAQTQLLWDTFQQSFSTLWRERSAAQPGGELYQPRLEVDAPELRALAIGARLASIWEDALGFAGCKIIRRIAGLAHVEDFEAIGDGDRRADCERNALQLARALLVERQRYADMEALLEAVRQLA
ncbi:MAG TPA: S-methyl-5-thioribose kinase [Steroidobacteraceae bacterium]